MEPPHTVKMPGAQVLKGEIWDAVYKLHKTSCEYLQQIPEGK